jgi:hypothetical protein
MTKMKIRIKNMSTFPKIYVGSRLFFCSSHVTPVILHYPITICKSFSQEVHKK